MTGYIDITYDLPKNFKPIYNDDGTIDFPVVLTSTNPDKEYDVIDTKSLIVTEATFVGYNHYKCGGTKVQTGAKPLLETLVKTDKIATIYIRVHPTDQMFFCEDGSKKKQTNGNLMEAIKNRWVSGVSIGYRYEQSKVVRIKNTLHYYDVIVQEISPLDIAPMNFDSHLKNKSTNITTMNEKNKCLDCVRTAGLNSVVVNPENVFARVSEITDTEIKAITFDGETITLDDTFEVAMYMAPDESSEPDNAATPVMNKACGCQLNKVKATPPDAFITSLTDAIDQMSKALTAQISELAMSFEKNKSVQPTALNADEIRAVVIDAINVKTAESYTQNYTAQPVTSWKNIHPNM